MQLFCRRYFLRNTLALVICLMPMIFSCSDNSNSNIVVYKEFRPGLVHYEAAVVEVECNDFSNRKERQFEKNAGFIRTEINNALLAHGIKPYEVKGIPTLKIECFYKYGWGIPSTGRHFRINFRYITSVDIKFIEPQTNEVIGGVEYIRPTLKRNPEGFIRLMLDALLGS
jgi:hypothetical protein